MKPEAQFSPGTDSTCYACGHSAHMHAVIEIQYRPETYDRMRIVCREGNCSCEKQASQPKDLLLE